MRQSVFGIILCSLVIAFIPQSATAVSGTHINVVTTTVLDPPTVNSVCKGANAVLTVKSGSISFLSSFSATVKNSRGETLRYASDNAFTETNSLELDWSICTFDLYYRGTTENYYLDISFYDSSGRGRSETLQIPISFRQERTLEMVQDELNRACTDIFGGDINWQLDMSNKAKLPKTKLTIKGKVFRAAFLVKNTEITIRTRPEGLGGKVIARQFINSSGKINITFDSKKSKYGIYYLVLPGSQQAINGFLPFNGWAQSSVTMILGRKNGYLILPKVTKDSLPTINSECMSLMDEFRNFN